MAIGETVLILIVVVDTIASLLVGGILGRALTRFPFGVSGFTGVESMVGRKCVVTTVSDSRLEVAVDSQIWSAQLRKKEKLEIGDKAFVKDVDGINLIIEKIRP